MFPVSVAIITKNEEHNIEDALVSVADAKEIIVVDAFSSDRTVEICRKYTDKVYQIRWEGFARQKQKAVDYTKGVWVLILDADERVTPELKTEIVAAISDTESSGFYIPRENYFIGKWIKHGGWWPDYTLRLFRKDKGRFEIREVHEKIIVDGRTGYLKNPLRHYTYRSVSDFVSRMEKYSALAAREIIKKSGKAGLFSLTVRPLSTFLKMYFLRLGFLDGTRGLMLAVFYGYYTFLKYAKTWEKQL
ncbi:MAG: glycosyltransferase family 2 protein [Nitrospiraceae bacterium]|nr:MAG: glycosyltransferase family 2 protein [Nitrospiraceae bacterium]